MQKDELRKRVDEIVSATLQGRLSRRDAIKRAGVLGVSATAFGLILRSQGVRAQDATPAAEAAAGSTIVVPSDLRTDLSGQTITVVLAEASSPDVPYLDAANAAFTAATGIEVNRIPGDQSASDRLASYNLQLGAQSSEVLGEAEEVFSTKEEALVRSMSPRESEVLRERALRSERCVIAHTLAPHSRYPYRSGDGLE